MAAAAARRLGSQVQWSPEKSLDEMDRNGVATALLSLIQPGVWLGESEQMREQARKLAREANDYGARLVQAHPGRFGLFATLPLPDAAGSLREIEYALGELKADGIGLMTSYGAKYLGDASFAPVWEELNRRKSVVYTHPLAPDCCRNLVPGVSTGAIEYATDTTRTIASLLFSGTAARCPRIRFVFAHVGGILPLVAEHLVRAAEVDATLAAKVPSGVRDQLRAFHYDTALRAHAVGMFGALHVVGAERLLFGSDAPLRTSQSQVDGLREAGLNAGLAAGDLRKIEFENARRLLAR